MAQETLDAMVLENARLAGVEEDGGDAIHTHAHTQTLKQAHAESQRQELGVQKKENEGGAEGGDQGAQQIYEQVYEQNRLVEGQQKMRLLDKTTKELRVIEQQVCTYTSTNI